MNRQFHLRGPVGEGSLCGAPGGTVVDIPDEANCTRCWAMLTNVTQPKAKLTKTPKDPPRSTGGRPYCSACGTVTGVHWDGCGRDGQLPDRTALGVKAIGQWAA